MTFPRIRITFAVFSLFVLVSSTVPRVLLNNIDSLILRPNQQTHSRRTAPVPQLRCLGGPCQAWQPSTVICKNMGNDGLNVNWACEAEFPSSITWGPSMEVSCEGYEFQGDDYVLTGSCGFSYTLEYVHQQQPRHIHSPESLNNHYHQQEDEYVVTQTT